MICYPKFQISVKVGQHCARVELCQTLRKDRKFAKPIESRGSTEKFMTSLINGTNKKCFGECDTTSTHEAIQTGIYYVHNSKNRIYLDYTRQPYILQYPEKNITLWGWTLQGRCIVSQNKQFLSSRPSLEVLLCLFFFCCCCLLSLGGRSSAIFAYSFFLVLNILQLCTTPQHQHIHTYTQRPPTYATTQLFFSLFACFPLFSFSFFHFVYEPDFSKLLLQNIQLSTISLSLNGAISETLF